MEKEKRNEMYRDMAKLHNEDAKTDKSLIAITEEELDELLDKMDEEVDEWDVSDDEQAEAWFEE